MTLKNYIAISLTSFHFKVYSIVSDNTSLERPKVILVLQLKTLEISSKIALGC